MISRLFHLKKFRKNKKVLLTGHTGFKGSWLSIFLHLLGAKVSGYSLKANKISLFNLSNLSKLMSESTVGDISDYKKLKKTIKNFAPDFLIHMAAQPLVRYSYDFPKYTYEVNTLGTINILNILNELEFIKSALIITTDKVYKNTNQKRHFKEEDRLGGFDPYSNSKACAELICDSYYNSFLAKKKISCVTARAGNVIGGGDFALNRIIPDFFRSLRNKKLVLRYPNAIRPWQHVVEPLYGYILLLMRIGEKKNLVQGDAWNFGPKKSNNIKVKDVVSILNNEFDNPIQIVEESHNQPNYKKESNMLMLNSFKSKKFLKWKPIYSLSKSIKLIAEWQKAHMLKKKNMFIVTQKQIEDYLNSTLHNDR